MASAVKAFGYAETSSSKLFYEQEGNKDGPAIFCIHGLGGTTNFFQPIVSSLQDSNIVRFDLSGHGRSAVPSSKTSIASYVQDSEDLIKKLGLKDVTVAAHSLGCLIALHLAAKIPELVTRLVLYGPVKPPPEAGQNGLRARAKAVRESGMISVADTVIGASLSPTTLKLRPELAGFARELLSRQQPEGYAFACEALAESTEPEWQKITSQVVIASGADDKVGSPQACEWVASNLKAAKKVEIVSWEQVGHWYTLENSKGSVEVVQNILKN